MRRVASELRVSAMALYRHVADKGELMTAMIDRVYTDGALPEPPPAGWREALEPALVTEWGIYREHPWAIRLTMMAGAVVSSGLMANAEWMLRVITDQGRSADEAQEILAFVSAYTSGMALQATRVVLEDHEFGMDADQWWRSRAPSSCVWPPGRVPRHVQRVRAARCRRDLRGRYETPAGRAHAADRRHRDPLNRAEAPGPGNGYRTPAPRARTGDQAGESPSGSPQSERMSTQVRWARSASCPS